MFKKHKKIFISSFAVSFLFVLTNIVSAQTEDKFALTITPPLIKINMAPGETWSSSIKIINNNPIATSIYAEKIDFKSGEDGGVVFLKNTKGKDEPTSFLLSQWLSVPEGGMPIGAYETKEISIIISVPANAEAGGHYAAILAGTKPNDEKSFEGSGIKVSSMLASLIMLNVKGDTTEAGDIREFTADKEFYTDPNIKFNLRFENSGNIHLQPQGEIAVYNMFGREKGKIGINQNSQFGNVLPKSMRKWELDWQGEKGFLASGRYRAELVLSFGEEAKQNVSRTVYFWIIDVKMTAIIIGSALFLILLIVLLIRLYIRRAIKAVGGHAEMVKAETRAVATTNINKAIPNVRKIMPAEKEHVVDLKRKG